MQIFSSLKTDKSGADHNRFLHAVCLRICTHRLRVIRRPHLKYTRQFLSFDRQFRSGSTDCEHQLIIGTDLCITGLNVFHRNFFLVRIKSNRLFSGAHFNSRKPRILLRCIYDQLVSALDKSSHIIRKSASGIRDILIFCDDCYFNTSVFSF